MKLVALLIALATVAAQPMPADRVMAAVRAAMAPALPFSETDRSGVFPADGKTEPLWMVRPPEAGEQTLEVIANPLNVSNQVRAARAMTQIQNNIEAAQRRAALQYEHAIAEAKRTGKSQEVDGVTLGDEGVAGAKIDADSHVAIEVAFNEPSYRFDLSSGIQPNPSVQLRSIVTGAVDVITLPSNTYRDDAGSERYREGETFIYLGRVARPVMKKRGDSTIYELTAEATPAASAELVNSLVLRLSGNEALIADLLSKSNWNALLELLK